MVSGQAAAAGSAMDELLPYGLGLLLILWSPTIGYRRIHPCFWPTVVSMRR